MDLQALGEVEVADVYKGGQRAAVIRRNQDAIEFRYQPDYLASDGRAVATTLPCTDEPVVTRGGAVPAFFAGLLPEGRRLSSLRRAVKASADDELTLLLAVGRDTIGDVQVVPSGEPPTPSEPFIQVSRDWIEVSFAELLADDAGVDLVGLPGVQQKVSARMISVPVGQAGHRFLLKLNPPEFPHVVENEAFFLDVARRARLECATAEVVHDIDGRAGLLVRRFDRLTDPDGGVTSVACEDACQVLGRWPADKYRVTTEEAATALAAQCAAEAVALQTLFHQLCFGWLTGNGDVHAKNLSILATTEGEWRVAPAYDVPSTVPYGDTTLALPIGGRKSGLSRAHLLNFAAAIGLPERAAVKVLDDVLARLSNLESWIRDGELPFPRNNINDLVAELRFRRRNAIAD
jgi:serine/threonine-protein kinase HipA